MAKIVKSTDAPEGDVKVSVGPVHFKVTDADGYETTNAAVIEAGDTHPFLEVEYGAPEGDSRAQMKEIREVEKARVKVDKANAEKDPYEPAVPLPETAADLPVETDAPKGKKETK